MDAKKLGKILAELDAMRRRSIRSADIKSVARALGRVEVNRGKHRMWESSQFSWLRPLSIPDHGGRDLATGTKKAILDLLEEDVAAWDAEILDNRDR